MNNCHTHGLMDKQLCMEMIDLRLFTYIILELTLSIRMKHYIIPLESKMPNVYAVITCTFQNNRLNMAKMCRRNNS